MNRTNIRSKPTEYDRDEDLERLQREFMNSNQVSSASVSRKAPPSFGSTGAKKPSLFAQRRAAAATATPNTSEKKSGMTISDLANDGLSGATMPGLESATAMPGLESTTAMPGLESTSGLSTTLGDPCNPDVSYEPVLDPNPEPHMPATKKMLDLTSMLGNILGQVTEHSVDIVTAPTLTAQHQGFPQPLHRSAFKKQQQQQEQPDAVATPPSAVTASSNIVDLDKQQPHDYQDENDQRIAGMTDDEIQAAREEILGSLSQDSITFLKTLQEKRATTTKETSDNLQQKQQQLRSPRDKLAEDDDENDLWTMKTKYFADVPLEGEKLAWMDDRFMTQTESNSKHNNGGDVDPVYRQLRFDLQGRVVDPNDVTRRRQQELHHHGDQPDQAGYTLAELFYLVRSQVPSQRALVLNILTRILEQAKKDPQHKENKAIIQVFRRRDVAAAVYFRSALDDRHLVVIISAIEALLALVTLDRVDGGPASLATFNTWLGHISQPLLAAPQETTKKWVNKMKSATVGDNEQYGVDDDAGLAERDIVDGLIQMDIITRLGYLMGEDSEVRVSDRSSMNRMVELLTCMAEIKGEQVCDLMVSRGLFDTTFLWVKDHLHHGVDMESLSEHRLCILRLMTAAVQGSNNVASSVKDWVASLTLPWLATTPTTHSDYQVQIETLKIYRVLACYGIVVPTLQDLQDTVMQWLSAAINSNNTTTLNKDDTTKIDNNHRSATAIGLLEVLLHAAADPHRTVPAHAVNWHQPASFQPLVTILLGTTTSPATTATATVTEKTANEMVQCSCLGYLSTWTAFLHKFPPESMNTVKDVWDVMQIHKIGQDQKENAYMSSHWILRYMQLWLYFTKWSGNKKLTTPWITADMETQSREHWKSLKYLAEQAQTYNDFYGRMAYYTWLMVIDDSDNKLEMGDVNDATMKMVVNSIHGGVVETWLARELLRLCVLRCLGDRDDDRVGRTNQLEPFYLYQGNDGQPKDMRLATDLMEMKGNGLTTLCYPRKIVPGATPSVDAWLFSPVDEIYYWDKSRVTQQLLHDQPHDSTAKLSQQQTLSTITNVVINTLEAVWRLSCDRLDHSLVLVTLMKIFLIGDREGQSLTVDGAAAIREIFWDEALATQMNRWMDVLEDQENKEPQISGLTSLEQAWTHSSDYTREAHVSFYQFYQSFLSQYASVSLGHRVYSRVLAFVARKVLDQVDYRHLLLSDYQDIVTTLKRQGYSLDLVEQKKNVV